MWQFTPHGSELNETHSNYCTRIRDSRQVIQWGTMHGVGLVEFFYADE